MAMSVTSRWLLLSLHMFRFTSEGEQRGRITVNWHSHINWHCIKWHSQYTSFLTAKAFLTYTQDLRFSALSEKDICLMYNPNIRRHIQSFDKKTYCENPTIARWRHCILWDTLLPCEMEVILWLTNIPQTTPFIIIPNICTLSMHSQIILAT